MTDFMKLNFSRGGQVIEIKLQDENFNTIFKGRAKINDKKAMKALMKSLEHKGVNFPTSWL